MKTLKIATIAIAASLLSLTSVADISISGDGRYRLGWAADGNKTQVRDYRMRTTITAGNSANGIGFRLDVDDKAGASGKGANEKGLIGIDNFNAYFTLGPVKVTAGDVGAGYPGTSGLKFVSGNHGDNGDIQAVLNSGNFSAFVRSSAARDATESADTLGYGLGASFEGIQVNYANFGYKAKGNSNSEFNAIRLRGNFSGTSVDIEQINEDAANKDVLLLRASAPVAGYTVKFAYGKWDANAGNSDDISMVGETILGGQYGINAAGNVGTAVENTFTGVGLGGSMGSLGFNVALGQLDDDTVATSDSVFDVNFNYALDGSTALKFGFGRAGGETGMGVSVNYSF